MPQDSNISAGAIEEMREILREFIAVVTAGAFEVCSEEGRSIVNGDDILCTMHNDGIFEDYIEPLQEYLKKHRAAPKEKRFT